MRGPPVAVGDARTGDLHFSLCISLHLVPLNQTDYTDHGQQFKKKRDSFVGPT